MFFKSSIVLFGLVLGTLMVQAQNRIRVDIANQYAVSDKFYFDLYISSVSGDPVFLSQTSIVLDFDTTAFQNPDIYQDKTAIRLVNAQGQALSSNISVSLPKRGANRNRILINYLAPYLSSSAQVNQLAAKVDARQNYYCLGRYYLSGYNYNATDVRLRVATIPISMVHAATNVFLYRTDGTNGGDTPVDTTMAPPPFLFVRLNSFVAQPIGRSAELDWTTSNEMNMVRYEIERSIDNIFFSKIGEVVAKGFNNQLAVYKSIDRDIYNPNDQVNKFYYRLKFIANNDSIGYSPVRAVTFDERSQIDMDTWPNPTSDQVNIQLRNVSDATVLVRLLDRQGAEISSRVYSPNEVFKFDLAGVAPGVYLIEVTTSKAKRTEKVVVWR